MRTLYHHWLSPASRKVRIVLGEKKLVYEMRVEQVWERRPQFLRMNPAGEVPVFLEEDGRAFCDAAAISEYLDELYPEPPLLGESPSERAEVRRLVAWFDLKFKAEVTQHLSTEKIMKRFLGMGQPDSEAIRCATHNLKTHINYIAHLAERRNYLAGNQFSLADIAAASHLSVIDYLGDVNWDANAEAKDWYVRVKSRRSMRTILADRIPGLQPPQYYDKLDF